MELGVVRLSRTVVLNPSSLTSDPVEKRTRSRKLRSNVPPKLAAKMPRPAVSTRSSDRRE